MSEYKFNNCQIGAVGENATATDTKFNMISGLDKNNCRRLGEEIEQIINFLKLKENKMDEEYILLGKLVNISENAINKESNDLIIKIKELASPLLYNLASGIGAGIIANYLYKLLNI